MSHSGFKKLFPVFFSLTRETSLSVTVRRWEQGEYICRSGDNLDRLFFLVEGRTRIFTTLYNGREFLYRIYRPGSIIGDIEYFLKAPAVCSVQCVDSAVTASLSMSAVGKAPGNSAALTSLGAALADKLKENTMTEAVNASYPVMNRLAAYFLALTEEEPHVGTLQDLAVWLGTSYRHLLRLLSELSRAGAVIRERRIYRPGNRGILREYAGDTAREIRLFDI